MSTKSIAPKRTTPKALPTALTLADLVVEWDAGTFDERTVRRLTGAQLAQIIEFVDEAFGVLDGGDAGITRLADVEQIGVDLDALAAILDVAVAGSEDVSTRAAAAMQTLVRIHAARCTILRPQGLDGRHYRVRLGAVAPASTAVA